MSGKGGTYEGPLLYGDFEQRAEADYFTANQLEETLWQNTHRRYAFQAGLRKGRAAAERKLQEPQKGCLHQQGCRTDCDPRCANCRHEGSEHIKFSYEVGCGHLNCTCSSYISNGVTEECEACYSYTHGQESMREPMACGHPRACEFEHPDAEGKYGGTRPR